MKEKVEIPGKPKSPFPYSDAIKTDDFVFVSGQIHTKDGKLVVGTTEEEAQQTFQNLKAALEASGVGFADVVKVTVYVTDMLIYGRVNDVYKTYFVEPYPAREMVCVKELPAGARIEISCIALRPKQ